MTKTVFLTLERTPLFLVLDQQEDFSDLQVDLADDFLEAYERVTNDYRVIQEALFKIYLEQASSDEIDEISEPVQDTPTLH